MHKGKYITAYRNSGELTDGRMIEIFFTSSSTCGSWFDPPESDDSECEILIDGVVTEWKDLPGEVTSEVIEELKSGATEDTSYDFGLTNDED